jgi:hypothetical protein
VIPESLPIGETTQIVGIPSEGTHRSKSVVSIVFTEFVLMLAWYASASRLSRYGPVSRFVPRSTPL